MAHKSLDVYLNDHLTGAIVGSNLAEQIAERAEGTPLADVMTPLVSEIAEDRATLEALMDRLGVARNPVKQATGKLAEAGSRIKFSGFASGQLDHGRFMALETLALGVRGKWSLWRALDAVRDDHPELQEHELAGLLDRAERQYTTHERERVAAAKDALGAAAAAS
jgi:hypothetical protein